MIKMIWHLGAGREHLTFRGNHFMEIPRTNPNP